MIKSAVAVEPADWRHLKTGLADGVIHRGLVIYNGSRAFQASDKVSVMPALQALATDREL